MMLTYQIIMPKIHIAARAICVGKAKRPSGDEGNVEIIPKSNGDNLRLVSKETARSFPILEVSGTANTSIPPTNTKDNIIGDQATNLDLNTPSPLSFESLKTT